MRTKFISHEEYIKLITETPVDENNHPLKINEDGKSYEGFKTTTITYYAPKTEPKKQ